jgi:dephospho-CoA kinase
MLQHLGAYTIDADGLTHRAMAPGAPAYKPIVDTFGQFILDSEKNINRSMLGSIVFSNPVALSKLESIVHPVVGQAIATLISRAGQQVVAVEAIKLLEGDLGKAVDEIWVVDASPETQFKRLTGPRKMSEAEARQRIAAQTAQTDKLAKATVVIKNDGNVEETWKQVQAAWTNIQKKLQAASQLNSPTAPTQPSAPTVPQRPPAQPNNQQPQTKTSTGQQQAVRPGVTAPLGGPPAPINAVTMKVNVKRGMPSNAEAIANFIKQASGKDISRMDVMMAFGQKSYLLAQDSSDKVLAVMGWQVENLITRVDEFYILPNVPTISIIEGLVAAIEAASKDLQSEVNYIFLPPSTTPETIQSFLRSGYESTTIEQIKIPAWREAVQEVLSDNKNALILTKKLREDRVLKPI